MDSLAGMEVFARVVRAGSFSAAARALNQTPSAVSKQIGRIEDRLGARLFNRTTRRLGLTEVGERHEGRVPGLTHDGREIVHMAVTHQIDAPAARGSGQRTHAANSNSCDRLR